MTGEITRVVWKHKVYGTLHVVEVDETARVLAASEPIHGATCCRHRLAEYGCHPDGAEAFNRNHADYQVFDPTCSDPVHLLADIGDAEKACREAESEWETAHRHAKALKETFEGEQAVLRQIVREATNPTPLPLFAQ